MDYQLERKIFFERMSGKESKYRELYMTLMKVFKRYSKKEAPKVERSCWKDINQII